MRRYVEITASGYVVSMAHRSHASTHLADSDSDLWSLTQEAVRKTTVTAEDVEVQVNMGRVVGRMDLVETNPDEPRIYAMRPGRNLYVPFVERTERPEARSIVLVLKWLSVAELRAESPEPRLFALELLKRPQYDLFSTFIGVKSPGLPGGPYETEESRAFWMRHALVRGSQQIVDVYDGIPPAYMMR